MDSTKYLFRFADADDSAQLLEIFEQTGFSGNLSLTYTRRPNAFDSLKLEADEVVILLCEDIEKKRIAGFGALAVRNLLINGNVEKAGYLFGLRGRPEYRNLAVPFFKGYRTFFEKFPEMRYCISTILAENVNVIRLLGKKRSFMPNYIHIGNYQVNSIKPLKKLNPAKGFSCKEVDKNDLDTLKSFYIENAYKSQFFPQINQEFLQKEIDSGQLRFYMLYKENQVVAASALWNQSSYKQLIVNGYKGLYQLAYRFSSVFSLMGYPKLIKPGNQVKLDYLSFWCVKDNNQEYFSELIKHMRFYANNNDYVVFGMEEKNPLFPVFKKQTGFVYKSNIYLVDYKKDEALLLNDNFPIYLECGHL